MHGCVLDLDSVHFVEDKTYMSQTSITTQLTRHFVFAHRYQWAEYRPMIGWTEITVNQNISLVMMTSVLAARFHGTVDCPGRSLDIWLAMWLTRWSLTNAPPGSIFKRRQIRFFFLRPISPSFANKHLLLKRLFIQDCLMTKTKQTKNNNKHF